MTDDVPATDPPVDEPAKTHTAVVVFHGMGQQRHYESMWRIIESLDGWVYANNAANPDPLQKRLTTKARRERLRREDGAPSSSELVYVDVQHEGEARARRTRFYEGYWAPAAVSGASTSSVLFWLLGQILRPPEVLLAPWRSFSRLRRTDLMELIDKARTAKDPSHHAVTVFRSYAQFVLRRPPEPGSFKSFLRYLEETTPPKRHAQVRAVARRWRRRHCARLASITLQLILLVLSVASVAVLVVLGILAVLRQVSNWEWVQSVLLSRDIDLDISLGTALSVSATVAVAAGLARFLRDAVGDVQQFVNYQETEALYERRVKIMEASCATLRHVLADPLCDRVVIFGHSLGSAVALDSILSLRAFNELAAPRESAGTHMNGPIAIKKIEHVVTCGSPIDKIAFFFATVASNVRAFERMADDLRGDIGSVPFSKAGLQPHVHWVNYWDLGDPISGPIATVARAQLRHQRVDNVRVANLHWPDVAGSHDAYFEDATIAEHLYRIAFLGESSFVTAPMKPAAYGDSGQRPEYDWKGPGRGSRLQSALSLLVPALMIVVVWTTLGVLFPRIPSPSVGWLGVFAGTFLMLAWLQRILRPLLTRRMAARSMRQSR